MPDIITSVQNITGNPCQSHSIKTCDTYKGKKERETDLIIWRLNNHLSQSFVASFEFSA